MRAVFSNIQQIHIILSEMLHKQKSAAVPPAEMGDGLIQLGPGLAKIILLLNIM